MVSRISLRLCSFFFVLFFFFSLHNLYWPVFWILLNSSRVLLILSFASSDLLLRPSTEFFISIIVLFTSRIYIWFFLKISIFLLVFFIWCTFAIPSFTSLVKLFFSSVSIFIITALKLLPVKSCPSSPSLPPRLSLCCLGYASNHPRMKLLFLVGFSSMLSLTFTLIAGWLFCFSQLSTGAYIPQTNLIKSWFLWRNCFWVQCLLFLTPGRLLLAVTFPVSLLQTSHLQSKVYISLDPQFSQFLPLQPPLFLRGL